MASRRDAKTTELHAAKETISFVRLLTSTDVALGGMGVALGSIVRLCPVEAFQQFFSFVLRKSLDASQNCTSQRSAIKTVKVMN